MTSKHTGDYTFPNVRKACDGDPLIPNLPPILTPPVVTMRHHFHEEDVRWVGACQMADGRTLFVFMDNGKRRGVAISGTISELSESRTERELERSRKRNLAAEASLETIYDRQAVTHAEPPAQDSAAVPVEDIDEFIKRKRGSSDEPEPPVEPEHTEPEVPPTKTLGSFNNMDPLPHWEASDTLLEGRPSEKVEGWVSADEQA